MTEKLKQRSREEILKLPKEAQEAINAINWANISEEIGKKYLSNENEINNFQVETLLILTGIEDAQDYALNIEREVGTSKTEAEKIADEVFEKILKPITETLEDNIKKNLGNKRTTPMQNIDFILSGGDYTSFLDTPGRANETETTDKILGTSNILEVKDRLIN